MLEILAESDFVEADVTFPGCASFPYVLNMVAFNLRCNHFQVVARVVMSRLTAAAYKRSFAKVFEIATNIHPEFDYGSNVVAWIVDFSLSQYDGLASVINASEPSQARAKIRGNDQKVCSIIIGIIIPFILVAIIYIFKLLTAYIASNRSNLGIIEFSHNNISYQHYCF